MVTKFCLTTILGITTMRISAFEYDGKHRVAVEHGPDERGCGMLTTQLSPKRGTRTFKPGKMFGTVEILGLKRLYWLIRWRLGI